MLCTETPDGDSRPHLGPLHGLGGGRPGGVDDAGLPVFALATDTFATDDNDDELTSEMIASTVSIDGGNSYKAGGITSATNIDVVFTGKTDRQRQGY